MEALAAIRAKFAPATPDRRHGDEDVENSPSMRRRRARGYRGEPSRPVRTITDAERGLIDREWETRLALSDATGAEVAADRELTDRHRMDNSVLTKIVNPGAVDRAQRHADRCRNARLLAVSEHEEALFALNAYRRADRDQRMAEEYASIVERDRERALQRRAAGLLPLERGERFPVTPEVARLTGMVRL